MYHFFPRSIMLNGPLKGKGFLASTLSSLQDNKNLHGQSNDYMVILSCGCSLTLCLLTVLITTFHYLEARCRLILMHTQISLTMGLIMIVIILKIAIFQQVHTHYYIVQGQGDPNQNLLIQMTTTMKFCTRALAVCLQFFKINFGLPNTFWHLKK